MNWRWTVSSSLFLIFYFTWSKEKRKEKWYILVFAKYQNLYFKTLSVHQRVACVLFKQIRNVVLLDIESKKIVLDLPHIWLCYYITCMFFYNHSLELNAHLFFLLRCIAITYTSTFLILLLYQETEAERYIFVSSIVALLAEYGISPRVINASTLSYNVKVTNVKCSLFPVVNVNMH